MSQVFLQSLVPVHVATAEEPPVAQGEEVLPTISPSVRAVQRAKLFIVGEYGLTSFPRAVVGEGFKETGIAYWVEGRLELMPLPAELGDDFDPVFAERRTGPELRRELLGADVRTISLAPTELPTLVSDPRVWRYYEAASVILWWKNKIQEVLDRNRDEGALEKVLDEVKPLFEYLVPLVESIKMDCSDAKIQDRALQLAATVYSHDVRTCLNNFGLLSARAFSARPPEWWARNLGHSCDGLDKILVTALAAGYMTISRDLSVTIDPPSVAWLCGSEFRFFNQEEADLFADISLTRGIASEDMFALMQILKNTRKHAPGRAYLKIVENDDVMYVLVQDLGRGVRESDGKPMLSPNLTKIFGAYSQDGDKGRGLRLVYNIVRRCRDGAIGVISITEEVGRNDVFMSKMPIESDIFAKGLMDENVEERGTMFMLAFPRKR